MLSRCDNIHCEIFNSPGVASNANDADGGAGSADKHIEVADVYTDEGESLGNGGVFGRSSFVAALNWASVALAGGDGGASGGNSCGGSKGSGSCGDCEES